MPQISVSLLSADLANLEAEARRMLDAGSDLLHIDVMDGHFVPNLSWGPPVLKCLHRALPDVFYDVHLMISDPMRYFPQTAEAGADLITFHLEALPDEAAVRRAIAAVKALGCRVGLSIKPATPAEAVLPYLADLDLVLVMSVEPGFGGQKFLPSALEKLSILKNARAERGGNTPLLEVDGGVNAVTGPQCAAAGADLLVVGSALTRADHPETLTAFLHRETTL